MEPIRGGRPQPSYRSVDGLRPRPAPGVGASGPQPGQPPATPASPAAPPSTQPSPQPPIAPPPSAPPNPIETPYSESQLSSPADPRQPAPNDDDLDQLINEVHNGLPTNQSATPPAPPRSSNPVVLIAIALLILAVLGVAAFFAFRDTSKPAAQNSSPQTAAKVSADDVQADATNVAKQLNGLNDTQDLNGPELSDQSLGL